VRNYEAKEVRPAQLERLEVVATEVAAESEEAWRSWSVLRCPACWTCYAVARSKDEGHSFMDPTKDWERIERIGVYAAMEKLGTFKGERAEAVRRELGGNAARMLEKLAGLAGRATNWHVRRYACECVIHGALLEGDRALNVRRLLEHADASVRVETVRELLELVLGWKGSVGDGGLKRWLEERARTFLLLDPPGPRLAAVLDEAPVATMEARSSSEAYTASDTHQAAAKCVGMAADAGFGVDDGVVARLADLLITPGGRRFEAAWALIAVVNRKLTAERVAILRERLAQLLGSGKGIPVIDSLAARVERFERGG
jgi:hypothetical protein